MTVSLPIDAFLPEIVASLQRTPNLVVVAEPGAGKTTRLPPALMSAPFCGADHVLVLQPRRIAARMAAARVASELGEQVGERVGFAVRFERALSKATRVLFLTEALLTRRLLDDPALKGVSCVVLDEFHERSLHTDVGLLLLRRLQARQRPDLRIIVMSATLDAERIAQFLEAPVVRVPGRAFPVTIEHLARPDERRLEQQVAAAVRKLLVRNVAGDVLVFLPGAAEIRRAAEACEGLTRSHDVTLAFLHGDLSAAEQARAVTPGPRRKVVLSTNVAETSLTLEGVAAVVDCGLARVAGHSPWSGLPTLTTHKISQASATQRAGRAGRVRAGLCLRLYTEADFLARPRFDLPEMARSDLTDVELTLRTLLARAPEDADFFEPPPAAAREAAIELLRRLGALSDADQVTALGARLLAMPVHPRVGRMLLALAERGHGPQAATLAALLAEREIRLTARTSFGRGAASSDEVGASDLLARFEAYAALEGEITAQKARRLELDFSAVRAVSALEKQLLRQLRDVRPGYDQPFEQAVQLATLLAFPDRVARRRRPGAAEVVLSGGGAAKLAETSVVKEAELMVAVDADERARGGIVVRVASAIEPEWLLEWFADRVKSEERVSFDEKAQRVESRQRLLYDGLVLDESSGATPPGPRAARMLAEAALARGAAAPWDTDAVEQWRRRLAFAARHDPSITPLSDDALLEALLQHAQGKRSFDDLRAEPFERALVRIHAPQVAARVEQLAPAAVTLPSGRKLKVHYEVDRPPWVASRLQDFFGMLDGPKLGRGETPLVLHLLAPNQRPVQVSTDLKGFWERHYPAIRKELMRRYPRHSWPEDPRTAAPPAPRPGRR